MPITPLCRFFTTGGELCFFSTQSKKHSSKNNGRYNEELFTLSPLGEEEKKMYLSYLGSQSSVRMNYFPQQTEARNAQSTDKSEKTDSRSFSDMLSLASGEGGFISDIQAYVQDSVNKVLDKIAEHASKNFSGQSGEYSVSITSISITIEMDEGETLKDVKNELDGMLSEDGYWGVEKTSQRIFDFAKNLAGDDPQKLEDARKAVLEGFDQAERIFGGKLPQISHDTKDAVMNKFDSYLANINSAVSAYA
jgi:hypothetical protein